MTATHWEDQAPKQGVAMGLVVIFNKDATWTCQVPLVAGLGCVDQIRWGLGREDRGVLG